MSVTAAPRGRLPAPSTIARIFPNATARGRYFKPQSGATIKRGASTCSSPRRIRAATIAGVSTSSVDRSQDAEEDRLARQAAEHARVEVRLRGLDRDLVRARRGELGQERVPARAVVDDRGIAEADVHGGGAGHALERAVERLDAVAPCGLGPRLQVGFVELHDVGAGGEEILHFLVHRPRRRPARARSRRRRTRSAPAAVIVNGPGTVIFTGRSVFAFKNWRSRTSTGCRRRIGPTTRGAGFGCPLRSMAIPGRSRSMPSSAVAKRFE
jgi:hypothetical protein